MNEIANRPSSEGKQFNDSRSRDPWRSIKPRLPIGPLRWFIGAPELHHWHHERVRETGNYANISPLMDILFGTYRCPVHEPPAIGIEDPIPRSYLGQLLRPFRRGKTHSPDMQPDTNGRVATLWI